MKTLTKLQKGKVKKLFSELHIIDGNTIKYGDWFKGLLAKGWEVKKNLTYDSARHKWDKKWLENNIDNVNWGAKDHPDTKMFFDIKEKVRSSRNYQKPWYSIEHPVSGEYYVIGKLSFQVAPELKIQFTVNDSIGQPLSVGDSVEVEENEDTCYFSGMITGFKNKFVVVTDQDDESFCLEPEKLTKQ